MTTATFDEATNVHRAPSAVGRPGESRPARRRPLGVEDLVARALSPFARVEPQEALGVLLLAATVFLLLTSYYLLKIAREPLILLGGGAEVKSYAAAGQAALLLLVVKGFAALSQRVGRLRLVGIVTLFFAANLAAFFVLGRIGVPLGVPFYLWVGVFSVTVISQFWSLASDLVTPEQGKRLFAIVGIGSSLGAVFGARLARALFDLVGLWGLLLAAAAFLIASFGLTALASGRFEREHRAAAPAAPLAPAGGFALLAKDRYLQLIAALVLILNLVNTTGEYVLDRALLAAMTDQPAALAAAGIAHFKARYFQWVNIAGVGLQLFAVSRVMRHLGMRVALLVLPSLVMAGAGVMMFAPILSVAFMAKVAENSVDYSLQNTARQALFLPTSREAKYQAKVTIDTFLVRGGDVLSGGLVWLGVHLHLPLRCFALVNVALSAAWMVVAWRLGARHRSLADGR